MTKDEMAKRLEELEAQVGTEADTGVDPQVLAKAQQIVQFAVMDIKQAFEVIGLIPTEDQQIEIENKLLNSKIESLTSKSKRKTIGKW